VPAWRSLPGWPRLALTGAVAAAMAIVLAVTGVISFGGGTLVPPASAAVLLNRAAAAALNQPVPTDQELIYSDTTIYQPVYARAGGKITGHVLVRQEEWQSPASPSAFYRTSPCDVDGNPDHSQATCGFEGGYAPGAQTYSTYAGLRAIPAARLPGYLATILPAPAGLPLADRQWSGANFIAQLNPVLPPGFGAALFRALAQMPGTTLLPDATDAAGAHGIGIARTVLGMQGELREELIFDPASYQLIGQQSAVPGAGGYVVSATALRQYRFVGSGPAPGSGASPRADQFTYTDTRIVSHLTPGRVLRGSVRMWQSVDGSRPGAFRITPCPPGADCLVLIPPGADTPALPSYAGLTRLPRDPAALAAYLRHNTACREAAKAGPASTEWNALTALLGHAQLLPPGLGQELFQTAAAIPGAVVLPDVTDAAGGHGVTVARNSSSALRDELIFAPGSYRFIGIQQIVIHPLAGLRAGAVWSATSLADTHIADTAPVAPLDKSYVPQECGYMPAFYAVSSGSSGTLPSGSASSQAAP
jgi:hypothetical protein